MTYIIGEIGQNHNGSVDIAKLIVELAYRKSCELPETTKGINAVKLTKRDLTEELTLSQMQRPYDSPHSFGSTYGEHRKALELTDEEHYEVYCYSKNLGLDFVETLCSPGCLSLLTRFMPDRLKVASRDLTNHILLEALAETKIPIILSTGMAGEVELDQALSIITRYHNDISILHCVSQYPTEPQNTNLNTVVFLKNKYPMYTIGYSDHTIGISAPTAAVALGAQIIEKHITLDRSMKGTDQAGSLGPDGVARMVRDIRITEQSLGSESLFICPDTQTAKKKLERSIAAKNNIKAGEIITENDLCLLSPGDGLPWSMRYQVVGKSALVDLPKNELIHKSAISD